MSKKYNRKRKIGTKNVGELILENHWSVQGLSKSLNITKEYVKTWAKSKH